MKKVLTAAALTAALFGASAHAQAVERAALSEQDVEAIVAQWVAENPDKILEAVESHFAAQEAAAAEAQAERAAKIAPQVVEPGDQPLLGNPDGAHTLVYFFDYQCGYCKRVHPALKELVEEHDDLRVIAREFPILGPASSEASRVALAVHFVAPEKYEAVHNALTETKEKLSAEIIDGVLGTVGLDPSTIRDANVGARVEAVIEENRRLAKELGISGTPFFFSGTQSIPGAAPKDALEDLVYGAK